MNTCQLLPAEDGLDVDVTEVERLLADQISAVATRTGITKQTALETCRRQLRSVVDLAIDLRL